MTDPELASFLVDAKTRTYAAMGDDVTVPPLLPGTRQLEHRSGPWLYRDVYVGGRRCAGQEIVYREGLPVWSMVYTGGVADATDDGDVAAICALLREALRLVDPALPCQGLAIHQQDGWRYENHGGDEAGAVQGYEWIEREGVACYGLAYHGGRIE